MNDNKRKRLMIASILGVISIGVTSLSFSYAWYASSSRVQLSGVDIAIRSERNLTISSSLKGDYSEMLEYEQKDVVGLFNPCSSMYRDTWTAEQRESTELYRYDAPIIGPNGEPKYSLATSGLFQKTVFIKADDDVYLTLDKDMILVSEDKAKNEEQAKAIASKYPELSHEEIVERLGSLKKCLRIAILDPDPECYGFYVIDPYKEGITYLGGRLDLAKTSYYSSYTKEGQAYETIYGEVNNRDKIVYDEALSEDRDTTGELTSFNAKSRAGVHPFNYEESVKNGMEIVKEQSLMIEEVEDQIIIPVYNETPKKLIVSIYMEGWDLDCTNAHMGGSFDVSLAFKISREMIL